MPDKLYHNQSATPPKKREHQEQNQNKKQILGDLTAAHVEGMMFVQRPTSQVRRDQLKSLHQCRPPLPLDDAGTGLILVADGNWNTNTFTHEGSVSRTVITVPSSNVTACGILMAVRLYTSTLACPRSLHNLVLSGETGVCSKASSGREV